MKTARCLLIIAGLLPIGSTSTTTAQQVPWKNCRYFDETGHYVCEEFLEYFDTRGGLEIFGYPLSERFPDDTHGGLEVQYFQRARMEWHPDNLPTYQVQLGLIVDELGYRFPPLPPEQIPAPDDPAHHYFPETQHVVSYAFLDAFREKGGLDIFGYPRSEFMYQDGGIVQYFQRARMEWNRNRPGRPIRLTEVGEWYIEVIPVPWQYSRWQQPPPRLGEPSTVFLPLVLVDAQPGQASGTGETLRPTATLPPDATAPTTPSAPVTELRVSASVRYPITGRTGTQTVSIYVDDQEGRPIEGATAQVIVHYPWGDQDCTPPQTSVTGGTSCVFDIVSPTPGKAVTIDIAVAYDGLTAPAQTSFMPWW
jgi:hypothetical protein